MDVKTLKRDGINEVSFTNFRFLSPPVAKASLKYRDGNSLANQQYAYAICRAPRNLAKRLVLAPSSEADDIAVIERDETIPETRRNQLIEARRGQGAFRRAPDDRWDNACAVTKCRLRDRASHIKPWRLATDEDRLNPANGILLLANIDILFDKGFVSFDDGGRMLMSRRLSPAEKRLLGLPANLKKKLRSDERRYLAHHRDAFGFDR